MPVAMAADVDAELRSLQRTYRSCGFRLTKLEAPPQIRITLDFECKDPDYRQHYPRQRSLPLEIILPDDYPNELPRFKIIDGNPEAIHRVVVNGLMRFCELKRGQPLLTISALKWLDDSLDGLMSLGCDLVNQESQQGMSSKSDASKAWTSQQQSQLEKAMKLVPKSNTVAPDERWRQIAEHVEGKSAEECVERFKSIRSALQAEAERESKVRRITANLQEIAFEPTQPAPLPPMEEPTTVVQGVELVFPAIQLLNIAMARMRLARFVLRCLRCSSSFDAELVPTQAQHGTCQKCNESWTAKFSFEIVHVSNCRFGTVQVENFGIADYLPSDIWISCGRCSSDLLLERVVAGPRKVHANCRECHAPMTLICGDLEFSETSCLKSILPAPKAPEAKAPKKRPARDGGAELNIVKKGTPLPDLGVCKHYAKSHRWLRFPCCGKAFPCDICHELGTASNPHDMKWALRQICGFCSQESAITGTGKCPCGRNTTRASSLFWNGGQGMRDPTRMARNDSRKHAGGAKTRSQKHKRVGQTGSEWTRPPDVPHA